MSANSKISKLEKMNNVYILRNIIFSIISVLYFLGCQEYDIVLDQVDCPSYYGQLPSPEPEDTIVGFLKVIQFRNSLDIPYQCLWNSPGYGYSAEFQIRDNCENPTLIKYDLQIWEDGVLKIRFSEGDCLHYGIWFNYPYGIDIESGYPIEFAIYSEPDCINQIYPQSGPPVTVYPHYPWIYQSQGGAMGDKVIYL